ncbi:MAG: hypothetical protein ACREOU_12630 [Candidatus Eiseniibacteriota bacterium]
MLWYKTWVETRWRFLIGITLVACSALFLVFGYPYIVRLLAQLPADTRLHGLDGDLARRIHEAAGLAREFRGYVWAQGYHENLSQLGTLFAVLLGTGGLLSHASGSAPLFTLSLPVSRERLLRVRAAAGLGQWFLIAIVPSLLIPLFAPMIGQSYGFGGALVHGLCLFLAGAVFFSLALLLSTAFGDLWRPLLLTLLVAGMLGVLEWFLPARAGVFSVMSGEAYFRTGQPPWIGLLITSALSAALLYGAQREFARRDF